MWADGCNYAIDVLQFCDGVLDGHTGANVDIRECPCMLIVVAFHLFCMGYGMFLGLLSTCLPFWCILVQKPNWESVLYRLSAVVKVDPVEMVCCNTEVALGSVCVRLGRHMSTMLV